VAVVVIGGIGYLGWIGYREVSVQMVLWQAKQFTAKPSTKPRRTDPKALEELRPRPWSSPLNNRHFDEAIAGARAAYDVGNYDRAIAFNTEALAIHPSDDLVWLLLRRRGDCYLENGEPDNAIADYEQAARLGDLDPHTYISRALALRHKGQRVEAMQDFEMAIATSPTDPLVYLQRATVFMEDGELDKALADYAKVLELNPRHTDARIGCAEIYLRQKESEKAITQSTIALKINPTSAKAYVTRAKAFAQLQMNFRALADLDAVTKLKSGDKRAALDTVAWCRATSTQSALRDGQKAVKEAMEACELGRWEHWTDIDTLAAAYAEARDFDQALKYQKHALRIMPARGKHTEEAKRRLQLYENHKPFWDEP
jgi:tetratricopeptide (TPR) repeat protein